MSTNGISVKNVKKNVDNTRGMVKAGPFRKAFRNGGTVAAIMPAPSSMPTTAPTWKLRHLELRNITTGMRKIMYDAMATPIKPAFVNKSRSVK